MFPKLPNRDFSPPIPEWSHGERSGYGQYTWADGSKYNGQWFASKEQGYGMRVQQGLLWGNRTLEGRWVNGQLRDWIKVTEWCDIPSPLAPRPSALSTHTAHPIPLTIPISLTSHLLEVPPDFETSMVKSLWRTQRSQQVAAQTAGAAQVSASRAQGAARTAVDQARIAQNESQTQVHRDVGVDEESGVGRVG